MTASDVRDREAAEEIVRKLEHGDDKHRQWLRDEATPLIAAAIQHARSEQAQLVEALESMLKAHGCGCEPLSHGGWTCPAHEALAGWRKNAKL
jgi:hypothetical protein